MRNNQSRSTSMYGSTADGSTDPLLPLSPTPRQSEERRRDFVKRRQNAKRHLTVTSNESTPVLKALYAEPSSLKSRRGPPSAPAPAPRSPDEKSTRHRHSFLFTLLNPSSRQLPARIFKTFISLVILIDLTLFILSTDKRVQKQYKHLFHVAEGIASTIFLLEYIARMVVITEHKKYKDTAVPCWRARLQYACTWPALVDLFASLPFFLEIPLGIALPRLTYLRFFRLFRILKTEGYVRAIDAVYRVMYFNREILYVAALLCIFLVLVTAFMLYYLKPQNPDDAQEFQSIPATLYLSTLMLTGQGGPQGDMPWYTKAVVLMTSVFSVAMFAIPASMLTWGFEAEAERMAKRARQRHLSSQRQNSYDSESSSSQDTDEEYFRIIAGEDESEGEEEESPWMKELRENFELADVDRTGTLTLAEFVRMQTTAGDEPSNSKTAQAMNKRIQALEEKVQANSEKLDRILELLQRRKGWR